ncbi:MAG: TlyA family RNA methyltransferase [Chloroflexi bacterium]|nr:TlyA family RNA methyltransferase [Chloroflexota bacterium]MCY4248486.1 TlyA family RNA methyltransferase [Chloroflexota bacterium]
MTGKLRLDKLLVQRRLARTRSKAAAMIMAAEVSVDGRMVDKPGTQVSASAAITLKDKPRYVGRGGYKLAAALAAFPLRVRGKRCADVGASTGGFTDCLLQHGAARVHAIDVGSGIIDYRLRQDTRVRLLENANARYLESLGERVGLAVIDVSFISLRLILPAARRWLAADADVIALVKPQFEAGKSDVGKGGIVRDLSAHRRVLRATASFASGIGLTPSGLIRSPITGAKGNVEYLLWLRMGARNVLVDLEPIILELTQPTSETNST